MLKQLNALRINHPFWSKQPSELLSESFLQPVSNRVFWVCMLIGMAIAYRLTANSILNQFYANGSYGDANLFSTMYWRNDWSLDVPGIFTTGTFFKLHLCLIMWIPTFISHFIPTDRIMYLASVSGVYYSLVMLVMTFCLNQLWVARHLPAILIKILAGFLFAFNPIGEQILTQALLEITAVGLVLAFYLAATRQQHRAAIPLLILALMVREDVGMHIFGLLFIVMAIELLRRRPFVLWRHYAYYATAAIGCSIIAMIVIYFFIGAYGNFENVYSGKPPYAHLDAAFIQQRLSYFYERRSYIWLAFAIAGLWAWLQRNPYIVAGYVSCIPWFILSILAKSSSAGSMAIHYAYPFMIACGWCFIAAAPRFRLLHQLSPTSRKAWIDAVLPVAFFLAQQYENSPNRQYTLSTIHRTGKLSNTVVNKPVYDMLEVRLYNARGELKRIRVDNPIKAIAPYAFPRTSYELRIRKLTENGKETRYGTTASNIDSLVFFASSYRQHAEEFKRTLEKNNLRYSYWLPGTHVWMVTNFDIKQQAPSFSSIFVERPLEKQLKYEFK